MHSYSSLIRHEGNRELFTFVELAAIGIIADIPIHLHVEGLRGTGKTTILRAARHILPKISRIKDCLFNCNPQFPHCPRHKVLTKDELGTVVVEQIPVPFLEISHSAKIGTIAGSLDLARLTDTEQPEAAMLPGTLPRSHRGIVLVDEVNRLADTAPELTDILLDAMGTKPGRVQMEEAGLPTVALPLSISVWATSNPDEDPGSLMDIRKQLSDRFDFMVQMERSVEAEALVSILNLDHKPEHLRGKIPAADLELGKYLVQKASRVGAVKIPTTIVRSLAQIYIKHHLESLRSLEAIKTGAILNAARWNRPEVGWNDVLTVTPAALRHRLSPEQLVAVLQDLKQERDLVNSRAVVACADCDQNEPGSADRHRQQKQSGGIWSRIVAWCQRVLGRRRDRYPAAAKRKEASAGGNKLAGIGRRPQLKPENPLEMPLVAPPEVARPLLSLAREGAITEGELIDDPTRAGKAIRTTVGNEADEG